MYSYKTGRMVRFDATSVADVLRFECYFFNI